MSIYRHDRRASLGRFQALTDTTGVHLYILPMEGVVIGFALNALEGSGTAGARAIGGTHPAQVAHE